MTEPGYGDLRASNADRERAIDVLKAAFAEGRLDQEEYVERVGQVQESRTYGELAALTRDLPVGPLGALSMPMMTQPMMTQPPAVPPPGYVNVPPPSWAAPLPPREPLALASLLAGIFLAGFPGGQVLALVLGVTALDRIRKTGRRGTGMAIAGTALGAIGTLFLILVIAGAA